MWIHAFPASESHHRRVEVVARDGGRLLVSARVIGTIDGLVVELHFDDDSRDFKFRPVHGTHQVRPSTAC